MFSILENTVELIVFVFVTLQGEITTLRSQLSSTTDKLHDASVKAGVAELLTTQVGELKSQLAALQRAQGVDTQTQEQAKHEVSAIASPLSNNCMDTTCVVF